MTKLEETNLQSLHLRMFSVARMTGYTVETLAKLVSVMDLEPTDNNLRTTDELNQLIPFHVP